MEEGRQRSEGRPGRRFFRYEGPVIVYATLIFILSSLPRFETPVQLFPGLDKIAHFVEYGFLGLLICRWLKARFAGKGGRTLLAALLIGAAYGVSDEWHQSFVPGRDSSLWDAIFDAAGAAAGAAAFCRLQSIACRQRGVS
jgi:VanZ family protein